jgi:hypothetical protein
MDATEQHVELHFKHRGYTDIGYEPDGNIPPDFLLDARIAVEVRRLNQNHFDGTDSKGLEEVAIPLWKRIKGLIESLGPPTSGESWFVYFRFSRPVEPWKSLEPKLRSGLQRFLSSSTRSRSVVAAGQGVELEVFCRTSTPHASLFVMAGCSDQQSGGWLLAEMQTNISHCASEKTRKIAKVQPKYPVWWLALVDHIGHGLNDFDREMFREKVSVEHSWDKIIVIDPRDHRRWFEI